MKQIKLVTISIASVACAIIALLVTGLPAGAQSGYPSNQIAYGDPGGSGSLATDPGFLRNPDAGINVDNVSFSTSGSADILTCGEGFQLQAGGTVLLESTATAGMVEIKSGSNSGGQGGEIELAAGNGSSTTTGGEVLLKAGGGGVLSGAELVLPGGTPNTPANTQLIGSGGTAGGGELQLLGGSVPSGSGSNGGPVVVQGGTSSNTGTGGNASLLGGTGSVSGTPGNATVQGGGIGYSLSSTQAGSATLAGGNTNGTAAGGNVILQPGSGTGVGGTPYGNLMINNATTGTSVGSGGSASTLPTQPAGYITIIINGTPQQIPYY